MPTAQPERTLSTAAGRCPRSRCATPPAPSQNSDNSADAQRLRAPLQPAGARPPCPAAASPLPGRRPALAGEMETGEALRPAEWAL